MPTKGKLQKVKVPVYLQYVDDVVSGKQVAGNTIRLACQRFLDFMDRDDMTFDAAEVDRCISFIGMMKHFKGKTAGNRFTLEPWQQFVIACIFGFKWKSTGLRVCREIYVQVARKAGKDALMAAIADYLLIADGEAAPEIILAANSTDQAKIAFEYVSKFCKSLGSASTFKFYRNSVQVPSTNGKATVISSDSSRADGLNVSAFILDEYHEAKDRLMYDVLRSSQGMREQPLAIIITTAGFHLEGPCHDMYELGIEVLNGLKTMDNFWPIIYELNPDDDYTEPKNFVKCQPNLGVTVTEEYMLEEIQKAKMDSTALTGVLTKTFNKWCQSKITWIPQDIIVKCMDKVDLEDYRGRWCVVGCDLSTVSDFSSVTAFFPPQCDGDKYVFKSWTFFPYDNLDSHPQKMLYQKFHDEGAMTFTPGNVVDYDFIQMKLRELNNVCQIQTIALDKWNATQFQISLTDAGFNVQEFSQAVGNYNACTKEFERLVREGKCLIDKSAATLWQFGNVFLKGDINGNVKPSKESNFKKIDTVISMTTALGQWLKQPNDTSMDFTSVW